VTFSYLTVVPRGRRLHAHNEVTESLHINDRIMMMMIMMTIIILIMISDKLIMIK